MIAEHLSSPKKPRLVFTDLQRRTLQAIFKVENFISIPNELCFVEIPIQISTLMAKIKIWIIFERQIGILHLFNDLLSRNKSKFSESIYIMQTLNILICEFGFRSEMQETKRPSKEMQVTIARQLGLEPTTVGNFFMNARRRSMDKWKDESDKNGKQKQIFEKKTFKNKKIIKYFFRFGHFWIRKVWKSFKYDFIIVFVVDKIYKCKKNVQD